MEAFLDDFGPVQVIVSKNYYNGSVSGFYLTADDGTYSDCVIRGVEEHEREVRYDLTIPAVFHFGQLYTLHESHGSEVPLKIRHIVPVCFIMQFLIQLTDRINICFISFITSL